MLANRITGPAVAVSVVDDVNALSYTSTARTNRLPLSRLHNTAGTPLRIGG